MIVPIKGLITSDLSSLVLIWELIVLYLSLGVSRFGFLQAPVFGVDRLWSLQFDFSFFGFVGLQIESCVHSDPLLRGNGHDWRSLPNLSLIHI